MRRQVRLEGARVAGRDGARRSAVTGTRAAASAAVPAPGLALGDDVGLCGHGGLGAVGAVDGRKRIAYASDGPYGSEARVGCPGAG